MLALEDILPLHLANVAFPVQHPLAGTRGPVYAFAIRHPDGLPLVDTGIGWGNEEIDTGSGLAVLVGQAIYSAAEYRQMVSTGQLAAGGRGNAERALASARRLVGPDPRHVYFSHDKTRWDRA
jgi:hypothetical protein